MRDTNTGYWSCIHRIIVEVGARKAPAYASFTIEGTSVVRIEERLHMHVCLVCTEQGNSQVALSVSDRDTGQWARRTLEHAVP
jgi:hypothetical protein